jgi:PAS domain S-box-containing protein
MHGTHRWLESHAIPLKNSEDGTTMMLSVTRDVTQQKQAQAALLESEMRWKFAIEGSGDGLWDWNVPENSLFVSERWKEMLGYQGDEMASALAEWSNLDGWSKRVHPDDLAQVILDVRSCLDGATAIYKNEHRILCKDNTWKWIFARGVVVSRDAQGMPLRMIGTDADITEQKQLQETLQASLKEKVILLNEVHHRVKNNLQVITSLLSLESARSNAPAIEQVLKNMQGRIRSMALLHQSLYRSGIFASADLGAYLQELSSQAFRAQANGGSVIRLKLDLERIMVSMDQAAPCGLLVNELISNCFKHAFPDGKEGEISLSLRAIENSNKVRLRIGDSGIGLPADFASRRENSLGLQLVTDLARQIGGSLEVGAGPKAQFIVDFVPDIQKVLNRTVVQVAKDIRKM